ncbi:hypothetical protein HanIR_Chr07g0327201 [Helianthus annuus]|nr:hypothetical protein HanIR_Chr07g0327201 [Helianthus annuus]
MWDTCQVVVQPQWIFGGKNVRILKFSHGIRIGLAIPGFLTWVYKVPNNLNHPFATFHTYRTLNPSLFSFTLPDFPFFFAFKAMKFNQFNVFYQPVLLYLIVGGRR